jgi:hypothetical protein
MKGRCGVRERWLRVMDAASLAVLPGPVFGLIRSGDTFHVFGTDMGPNGKLPKREVPSRLFQAPLSHDFPQPAQ